MVRFFYAIIDVYCYSMPSVKDVSHYLMISHGDQELQPMVIPAEVATVIIMQHLATMTKVLMNFLIVMTQEVVEYVIVLITQVDGTVTVAYSSSIDLLVVIHLQLMPVSLVIVTEMA